MKFTSRRCISNGFTLVALMIVVALLAFLAAILLPALAKAKQKAKRINCVNNLKQCGLGFFIWAGDHNDRFPMDIPSDLGGTREFNAGADTFHHFQVMSNELNTPKVLICPADMRAAAANFARLKNSNVSYFVGLDAGRDFPQRFLDGDRNITGSSRPENGILKLVPGSPATWTSAIHNRQGNVGLADGSVHLLSNAGVRQALKHSGSRTNTWRISLPE